jgi:1-acyl-sn-glycerol-3-phosphate acyltransferase
MGSSVRAALRLARYLLWTALLLPLQALAVALDLPVAARIPVLYHRTCLRLLGFELAVRGKMASPSPVLFVSNHTSYLDISILGALIPGSFVAKHEVADWPLFGVLAKLQRTVFVNRSVGRHVAHHRNEMAERLAAGGNLILFPEGTSDDGTRILPFKSAFLAAAAEPREGRLPLIQPVSIAYTKLDGMPMGKALRPFYAWYGDMELFPHLWRALGLGIATVEVQFHEPVTAAQFATRRALADYCRAKIAAGLAGALAGRDAEALPPQTPAIPAESAETGQIPAATRP